MNIQIDKTCYLVSSDIHAAAVKIAEISNIALDGIHNTLIMKWLQSGNKTQQESDTVSLVNVFSLYSSLCSRKTQGVS